MDNLSTTAIRKEQAVNEFKYIITNYILPLLEHDGDIIIKYEPTKSKNIKKHIKCFHKRDGAFLYFFPALSTPQFHFRIKTNNDKQKLAIAEEILKEIVSVSKFDYRTNEFIEKYFYDKNNLYRNACFDVAFEIGLCNWLGNGCVYDLIKRLEEWSLKTYEGNHTTFGFIVDAEDNVNGEVDYISFLRSNHSAVFTDGVSSGIKLNKNGNVIEYFSVGKDVSRGKKHISWTPYEFTEFTNLCSASKIGIVLQNNGDILIFKSKRLIFVKRSGKWLFLDYHTIHSTIMSKYKSDDESVSFIERKGFADEVYLSVLDSSFSHAGGCIAIVDEKHADTVSQQCFPKDSFDNDCEINFEKKSVAKRLIFTGTKNEGKYYFQDLNRKLRLELLSLDGATVLDSSGKILCVGAIVKIDGGSDAGGRTAAAKALAKYGLSVKISMDGCIQFFASSNGNEPVELLKTL